MAIVLLIAGIGFLLAGLVAVGFGIPIQEFSFGNTLILAGSITASTGMILIGLWAVIRELVGIAQRLGPGLAVAQPSSAVDANLRGAGATQDGLSFGAGQPAAEKPADLDVSSATPPPWKEEAAGRDRGSDEQPSVAPAEPSAPPRRRNLMFSSSRKERERAREKTADTAETNFDVAPVGMSQPASFEDAWPQAGRSLSADPLPSRRTSRTPSTFSATENADRYPPVLPPEQPPAVTVLKSGVVDGMAYSLYSDGSIEAQMPEGMMRFTSIDELRSHLDQRP